MKITKTDKLISSNLKRILVLNNIKQKDFIAITGKSKTTISGYLNATLPIGKEMIEYFCDLLGVRPFEFYREDEVNESPQVYTIPSNCPADPVCKDICTRCKDLKPVEKDYVKKLTDIFQSNRESTKKAIKDNLDEFHEIVRVLGGNPSDEKKSSKTGGTV